MSAREKLRAFVEGLPEDQVEAALRVLESMSAMGHGDPMVEMLLNAEEDDEPLNDQQRADLEQALGEIERGETTPWEQVREGLG